MLHFFKISLTTLLFIHLFTFVNAQDYGTPANKTDDQRIKWPNGEKMAISLSFDDARLSQVDKGIPILDSYQVKGTFYVSPDRLKERLEGWRHAVASGHDIGNHTIVHPCSGNYPWARHKALENYTIADMYRELDSASHIINKMLGVTPVSFAYTCGHTYVGRGMQTHSYVPLISAMFATARTFMDNTTNDPLFCDFAQLAGIELDGKSFAEIKDRIEAEKERGGWLILAGHEMNDAGRQTSLLSTIDSICRFAMDPANEIWIDHVTNVGSYLRDQRGLPSHTEMMPYQNPALPVDQRVEDLLSRMTLEEKIGQLNMPCAYHSELGRTTEEKMEGCKKFSEGTLIEGIGPGGGFFTLPNNVLFEGPEQQARFLNELQKIALGKTRLKIPLLLTEEGTHGLMCAGATIFPEGPALGSTWNMELLEKVYETAAREARAIGIHQLFTLVIEPNRDPRLGRNQEGYSEDPYLCSRISETIVRAVQGYDVSAGDKVVAGLCHYPGQSAPVSGLERGAMEISERMLREVFLPPWVSGIKDAGALGVMATYPTIDGIPIHSSSAVLTDMLRGELGFEGLVLSEGGGVNTMVYTGLAENLKEASAMAANAGMDVSISFSQGYLNEMTENVEEGKVSMKTIDRSVRRILEMKYRLGLFDNPFVDPQRAAEISHTEKSQKLALQAAQEGIVLLKNEDRILPLSNKIKSIAVIGPNADDEKNQLGDYTSRVVLQDIVTVLDGISNKLGEDVKISYVKGCNVKGDDLNEIDKAVEAARNAEIAVLVIGENEWQRDNNQGTDGEGYDVATLELTGKQAELARKVMASGTPTVVVLINGRALAIPWIDENIPAIVEAWIPGEKGGDAIADVLFGDYNPGGKLAVTFPRHAGQLPVYYNYKPSKLYWLEKGWGNSYADIDYRPLYEFGHGLSYTTFEYTGLTISPESSGPYGQFHISAEIKNTGNRAGSEVAQLYLRDKISTVVRPVKELKGFTRIWLEPGESATVSFTLTHEELKMLDKHLDWVVEPGEFAILLGSSSRDIRLEGTLRIN
ncbi:MAG: glycoside hydrolase family 3 C-terminal domain-containing protein [Bacteroidales bacterium]